MSNNDVHQYKTLDDDEKIDFLMDYEEEPDNEFIDFLMAQFDIEEDEFVQVEIVRFLSEHCENSVSVKDFFIKKITSNADSYDEMVLSHLAQGVILFDLQQDDYQTIYTQILTEKERKNQQEDFLASLLRLFEIKSKSDKTAKSYLEKLI